METVLRTLSGEPQQAPQPQIDRRSFLRLGLVGAIAATVAATVPLVPIAANTRVRAAGGGAYSAALRSQHTGEVWSGVYRVGDRYAPEAFAQINALMRDHRTGEVFPIDPRLMDIIHTLRSQAGVDGAVDILSGYRSPQSNAYLRRTTRGVAKNSYHMYGQAVDIRLPRFSSARLARNARGLRAGGVGYYRSSGFVHIDTGPVRSW